MRKLFVHPITAMLLSAALLLGLREQFGVPRHALFAMLFLALYAYGCSLLWLIMFYSSAWVAVLKALGFPDAWKNRAFISGLALSAYGLNVLVGAAIALFLFDADPAGVTRFCAAITALATAAATIALSRTPEPATAP